MANGSLITIGCTNEGVVVEGRILTLGLAIEVSPLPIIALLSTGARAAFCLTAFCISKERD